jgi:hypothetical protein
MAVGNNNEVRNGSNKGEVRNKSLHKSKTALFLFFGDYKCRLN